MPEKRKAKTERGSSPSGSPSNSKLSPSKSARSPTHKVQHGSRRSPSPSARHGSPTGHAPPSSLARATSPTMVMSPTQRGVEDMKRIKARNARKGLSPGPGAYDPRQLGSTSRDYTGRFAFRSSTERTVDNMLKHQGDPGAYEPQIYLSLVKQATSSWNNKASEGKIAFGATQERVLDLHSENWNEGEKTPGPAAYTAKVDEKGLEWEMRTMNDRELQQSAAFKCGMTQRPGFVLPSADTPGPGAYDPKDHLAVEHLPGANPEANLMSKVGRDSKYAGDSVVRSLEGGVGPGAYESHISGTIAKQIEESVALSSQIQVSDKPNALGFGARYSQHELPHEKASAQKQATPGPGSYDVRATRMGAEATPSGHASAFTMTKIATEIAKDPSGDPGSYEPNHNRELAWQAKQTFREPAQQGRSGFGASTARQLRIPPDMARSGFEDVTPGPAFYKPSFSHRMFTKSVSAFRSMVPQRSKLNPVNETPGPGTYDPKDHLAVEHLPGANPEANLMSKVGRGGRYGGDTASMNLSSSGDIGPGAYESHVEGTISQVASSLEERTSRYRPGNDNTPLGFTSSSTARALPHELALKTELKDGLGPGAYNPYTHEEIATSQKKSHNKLSLAGKLNFGTFSAPRGETGVVNPARDQVDAGVYEPNHNRVMAWTARFTHRKSASEGKNQFGSQSARVLRLEGTYNGRADGPGFKPDTTPGPAAYTAKVDEKGLEWEMRTMNDRELQQSAAFKCGMTQRPGFVLPSADTPGPGAYDPKDHLAVEHLPGANPEANLMSKVGRGGRYGGDTASMNLSSSGDIGPGAYDPKVTNDGQLNTMEARSEDKADHFGWSASFISSNLRQLWQGWFGDGTELNEA